MRRHTITAATALLALTLGFPLDATARPNNRTWELLGEQKVGFGIDRDTVRIGRDDGDFRKIQLRVRGNDIEMRDLKVVYGNGQVDDIPVREHILAGGTTRPIDLRGASPRASSSCTPAARASRARRPSRFGAAIDRAPELT